MARDDVIRAAGVVLLREHEGTEHFLAVHRPVRQDWSLPKGKLEAGEHRVGAAVRECDEETGFTPILQSPLRTLSYSVLSRPKVVHYWRARVRAEEGFTADDEIDDIRWVPVTAAVEHLTYSSDVRLVEQAANLPDTLPLVILRHTQAMKRSDYKGDVDTERPLAGKGRSQSRALIPLLDAFGIDTVHSSSALRCTETVRRLAKHVGTDVHPEAALTEEAHHHDAPSTARRAAEIARLPSAVVVCSHRPVLPTILDAVAQSLDLDTDDSAWGRLWDPKLPPGGFLVVHRAFTDNGIRVTGVERHTLSGD